MSDEAGPTQSPSLTLREAQIAEAVAQGRSNREIAGQLGITEQTVKNHLTSIFAKVGVDTRLKLALAWIRRKPSVVSEAADRLRGGS